MVDSMVTERGGGRSYGYTENTASWSIDLGDLDADSGEALNQIADGAIQAFLQAFADMCTVEDAEGNLAEIGEDRRLSNLWTELRLEQDVEGRFRPRPDEAFGDLSDRAGLSRVLLACGVKVEGDRTEPTLLSEGIYFHYNSGLSPTVGEPVTFDSPYVTVSAEVDPWLDAPYQGGRFVDNRTVADLNRPRLERALRSWEAAMGKPISEVESAYPDLVDRYGFRSGGEPDPS
jgi:hypothetical protein